MMKKIYLVIGVLVLGLYGTIGLFGWEMSPRRQTLKEGPSGTASALRSRAGHRSFWIFGYRGGK